MSESERTKIKQLDEAAEKAGGYVTFFLDKSIHVKIRELADYCRQKGIEPAVLTLRELHQFITA